MIKQVQNDRTGTEDQLFFSGTVVGPSVLKNLARYLYKFEDDCQGTQEHRNSCVNFLDLFQICTLKDRQGCNTNQHAIGNFLFQICANLCNTNQDAIAKVMRTFGWTPTEEELKDLVNVIDVDGNGDISFNEFVWLMTK